MMKTFLSILLLSCLLACNSSKDEKPVVNKDSVVTAPVLAPKPDSELNYVQNFDDTALASKITNKLMMLPFVIKSNKYIDSFSNHKHGMAFLIDSAEEGSKELFVKAGYDGDERFETYYQFYVNPVTLEIKVYDVVNDRKLTVKEFIKTQH